MIKTQIIRGLFILISVICVTTFLTGANFSDRESTKNNSITAGTWTVTPTPVSIILNEAMVNPIIETGENPDGEWVELYNNGIGKVDVNGWQVRDSGSQFYTITAAKTNTGSTEINPGGFLAIYRNMGTSMFNNDGDSVRIFNGSILIDSLDYSSSTDAKSWSRVPDGSGVFTDNHTPTPGGPNV